jgi:hypothetical protein
VLDLTGPRLKLRRAKDHLDSLTEGIRAYLRTDPSPYRATVELDRKNKRFNVRGWINREPEPMWPIVAGEIAHHLRSALDQVIYQAAPNKLRKRGDTNWPIFVKEDEYLLRAGPALRAWLKPEALAVVERAQPFERRDIDPRYDLLAIVADLNNADKHRLTPMTGCAHEIQIDMRFPDPGHGAVARIVDVHKIDAGRIAHDGAPVGWFNVVAPDGAVMYMKPITLMQVQFGKGTRAADLPVPELCRDIHARVTGLIDDFDRQFR